MPLIRRQWLDLTSGCVCGGVLEIAIVVRAVSRCKETCCAWVVREAAAYASGLAPTLTSCVRAIAGASSSQGVSDTDRGRAVGALGKRFYPEGSYSGLRVRLDFGRCCERSGSRKGRVAAVACVGKFAPPSAAEGFGHSVVGFCVAARAW